MPGTDPLTPLISRLLDVVAQDIVPLTREEVKIGNKIFGAAVLRKEDRSLVVAGTNLETECPLWHGEVATIKRLYELPAEERPEARDCLFLASHEPCPLCLAAITWTGFDNFYYLFRYEDTRDAFHIPHDLRILKEVFRRDDYARENFYWKSNDIVELIEGCDETARRELRGRVDRLRRVYAELSSIYQASKGSGGIPLD
jgi:tRNA(Arg) A34 adenosine deaminase TadA